jgi:TrkA-N domain/RyR domain
MSTRTWAKGSSPTGLGGSRPTFFFRGWQWLAIMGLGLVSMVLGYAGFRQHFQLHGDTRSALGILYVTIQLFTLESGGMDGPVPWQLELARFMAPIVPVWTVLKTLAVVFRDQLQMLRLRYVRGHVVICGLGRNGARLTQDYLNQGERVVVIENDDGNDWIDTCREAGAIVLEGDARNKAALVKVGVFRAKHVVAVCGDDAANVEAGVRTLELVQELGASYIDPVRCSIHAVDLKLCTLFKQHPVFAKKRASFRVTVFNIYENTARLLLEQHPLDQGELRAGDPRSPHLIVVGLGKMGESVALQAAKTAHYANGKKLRLTLVDLNAEARWEGFLARNPRFDAICDVALVAGDVENAEILGQIRSWAEDPSCVTTLIICLDNDARGISCVLSVLWKLANCPVPVLVRQTDDSGLAPLLETRGIGADWVTRAHPFGVTSSARSPHPLASDRLDRLARAIHESQVEARREEGRDETDPSMRPWDALDPMLKDSSRQEADHISIKLRAIGCLRGHYEVGRESVEDFASREVELLARMEHARWTAERLLAGWTRGPRDPERRSHPYLVAWSRLPKKVKDYNRQAVREIPSLLKLVGERVYRADDGKTEK